MLNNEERALLEESIIDTTSAARAFLKSNKQAHFQLLSYCVNDSFDIMSKLGYKLVADERVDQYRIRLLIPTQIVTYIDSKLLDNK